MRPVRFLETRSSGLKDVPGHTLTERIHSTDTAGHAFVPSRLSKNLITCCHVLGDVFGLVVLLDSAVVILSVAFEPVKGGNPHLIFEGLNVNTSHWVVRRRYAAAGERHAFVGSGG